MSAPTVHELLTRQRLKLADLLEGLTPEQAATPSLSGEWTVHQVAAHLTSFLRAAQPKLYVGMTLTMGDIDPVNRFLTDRAARASTAELARKLRRLSRSRVTLPRSGYDPILADAVLHELDVRLPLGLAGRIHEESLWVSLNHLATTPAPGYAVGSRLAGLRLEATDTGWSWGSGALVCGPAEDLLLGASGRAAGLAALEGDGVPLLSERVTRPVKAGPVERMGRIYRLHVAPPPRERRSRRAVAAP
jgi:uncharacterized protein (TIGR03083 family)